MTVAVTAITDSVILLITNGAQHTKDSKLDRRFSTIAVAERIFLRSLCQTLPIIQRLPVGTSLTVVKVPSERQPEVNLGSLRWIGRFHPSL